MPAPADGGAAPHVNGAGSWHRARPWLIAAAAAGLLDALAPWLGLGARSELSVHNGLQLLAAALAAWACLRAARDATGHPKAGWLLLGAGAGSWAVGQVIWSWYEVVLGVAVPFPGWDDFAYLAMYPMALAGFLLLSPLAGRGWVRRTALVLDGLLAALAVSVLAWPFLHEAFHASSSLFGAYVTIAYPLADVLVIGVVGGMLMRGVGAWRSALGLVYGAFLFITVADIGYSTGVFRESYATGSLLDAGWIMGFLVLAAAAQAPLPGPDPRPARQGYTQVIGHALPITAVLVGLASFVLAARVDAHDFTPWQAGLGMLVMAAVLRQAVAGLEHVALQREREALQEDYRRLFDNMTEGVAHGRMLYEDGVPVDFEYLRVNPSFTPLTGLEDVVGRLESEVIPGFRQSNADLLSLLGRVARGGVPERVEQEVPGLGRWFSITAYGAGRDEFVAVFDNITERKTAEGRLRFQARLLDSVGQAVMATDVSGRITYWGPGAVALYGWEASEVIGKPIIEVTPSETSKDEAAKIFASLAAGKSWSGEFVLRRKDGSSFTALVRDDAIFEDGRLIGIIGISQDISATKQLERRLRFQAHLLENVSQAVIATDLGGNVAYWNIAAERLFGWTCAEVIGRPIAEFWGETLTRRPGADADGVLSTGDYPMHRRDGSQILVNMGTSPLPGRDGGLEGFIAICQDVTEQRKAFESVRVSEALLKEAQALAKIGSWELDPRSNVLWWSDQNYRIFGVEPGAFDASYEFFLSVVHPDDREMVDHVYRTSVANRMPYSIEHRLLMPDGSVRWVHERCETYYDGAGKPIRSVGTTQDITLQKEHQAHQAVIEGKEREVKRLEELNKMRMDFLNTAAHDLKTPLTPLKLQMATLRMKGNLDKGQANSLDLMDRNLLRFQALIEDMLDAARLQAGKLKLRRAATPLAPLVREAVASFEEAAKQGRLEFGFDSLAEASVDADPMKCMQVLMNLVSNAVKYTPAGGHVRIGITATGTEAIVQVADDGLGMTPEQLGKLFQPFVRLHEEVPGAAKGTGLGLYISKGIVEQHGGRLWAQSAGTGKGSTFSVAWPLAGHADGSKTAAAA